MTASRVQNTTSSFPMSRLRGDPLAALDALPPALRRAHWDSNIPWDPIQAAGDLKAMIKAGVSYFDAIGRIIEEIERNDQAEIRRFAKRNWPGRGDYPHLAAKATIQRYGAYR